MNLPSPKICRRIRKLFAMLGSPNAGEAENARGKVNKLLAEHNLTWNDLPAILAATDPSNGTPPNPGFAAPQTPASAPEVNVLDLVLRLVELHVDLSPEQRMATALWVLHTYCFDRFSITPRFVLTSPVRGCGKTTFLGLLGELVADPHRTDSVTPAAIYHLLAHGRYTL